MFQTTLQLQHPTESNCRSASFTINAVLPLRRANCANSAPQVIPPLLRTPQREFQIRLLNKGTSSTPFSTPTIQSPYSYCFSAIATCQRSCYETAIPMSAPSGETHGAVGAFRTTHWTVVLQAARPDEARSTDAFAQLYRDYWPPLYAYVRRRGLNPAEAEDITQGFFLRLIEKSALANLQREGGRFRSYLLGGLKNFMANEWDRAQTQKRGSGQVSISLNAEEGETCFLSLKDAGGTPESIFERQWVFTLLAQVMGQLQAEEDASGKSPFFQDAKPHLQGERSGLPYAEIAARHAMSEGAVKVAVYRLRQRYGELLRETIARTVSSAAEVEDELRHLLRVMAE
jgi:RNA polymerase sigma factor (sigma-70 family)